MSETERAVIKWLVEDVHYPFDCTFNPPPPVDLDALADHWSEWDNWDVSLEEARRCVREEAGASPPSPAVHPSHERGTDE